MRNSGCGKKNRKRAELVIIKKSTYWVCKIYFKGLKVNENEEDGVEDQWWILVLTMNHSFINLVKNIGCISVHASAMLAVERYNIIRGVIA